MPPRQKRVALVTGATTGIGEAAAQALAAAGFAVYGTGRSVVAGERRGDITLLPLDVTDEESVEDVMRMVFERAGHIDVLVNNAGSGLAGAAEESSVEQVRSLFETNLFGVIRTTRAVLPYMRKQDAGRIINVSSVVGLIPAPFMSVYASSKHALEGYSESMDHEVRTDGIRVLLVEPAYTKTDFGSNAATADQPLALYGDRMQKASRLLAEAIESGDDVEVVAKAIVAAATDRKPKLRYPAGKLARRVSRARRLAPQRSFDKQFRKLNELPL